MSRFACLLATFILISTAAAAAEDAPAADPSGYQPLAPAPIWAGVFVGGDLGYQWGTSTHPFIDNVTGATGQESTTNPSGITGGAHVGYNWQIASWVFGLEGDIDGSGANASALSKLGVAVLQTRENIEGAVLGRLGFDWNRTLFFVQGGAAIGSFQNNFTNVFTGQTDAFSSARVGWTVGGGIEYAINEHWSVRGTYRYSDYGSYSDVLTNSFGGRYTVSMHETSNTALVGFSYKFSTSGPVDHLIAY